MNSAIVDKRALTDVLHEVWTNEVASRIAGEPVFVRSFLCRDEDAIDVAVASVHPPWHDLAPWYVWERLRPPLHAGSLTLARWMSDRLTVLFRDYRHTLAATVTAATFPC